MSNINRDVIFLILKQLQNDRKSLHSCLFVNRTWCETAVPILWKFPDQNLSDKAKKLLLVVIILHLPDDSFLKKNILKGRFLGQRLSFNYVSFWRHLNLCFVENMFGSLGTLINEILKVFINRNTRFTHLYVPTNFKHQIHNFPGVEHCLSGLKFLQYYISSNNQKVLEGLAKMINSIEVLEIYTTRYKKTFGLIKLIEAQKNLNDVRFYSTKSNMKNDSFYKTLEESLIKHVNTIKYLRTFWFPFKIRNFVNLVRLEINLPRNCRRNNDWSNDLFLPGLKILKTRNIDYQGLEIFIENTRGSLTEINISNIYCVDEKFSKIIYHYPDNLRYLRYQIGNDSLSGLEGILTNCKHLIGLVIASSLIGANAWDNLFKILAKSSPTSLFKFKIRFSWLLSPELESYKVFFDNWKGRRPMLLQTIPRNCMDSRFLELFEKCKAEGIIKKYDNDLNGNDFETFEWIQKRLDRQVDKFSV